MRVFAVIQVSKQGLDTLHVGDAFAFKEFLAFRYLAVKEQAHMRIGQGSPVATTQIIGNTRHAIDKGVPTQHVGSTVGSNEPSVREERHQDEERSR